MQHAVAAHVYKYGANGYQSVGQLGVAVLGTASTKKYKVLAYDAKKTPVASATMHANFSFTPAANNYASFYDDAQQVRAPSLTFPRQAHFLHRAHVFPRAHFLHRAAPRASTARPELAVPRAGHSSKRGRLIDLLDIAPC